MHLPVLFFLWITFGGHFVVPEPDCPWSQCVCSETFINCSCPVGARSDIRLTTIVNFDVKSIEIRHCGTVTISSMSFLHLHLNSLILDDLLVLKIKPVAILGAAMHFLEISNIVDLQASSYGLNGLNNLSKILLKNVTAEIIPHTFLVASNIENVNIEECNFEEVDYGAFAFRNTTNIMVANTKFQTFRSMAMVSSGDSEKVTFYKSSFQFTENSSFSIEASQLIFQDCMFGELGTEVFLAEYVDVFTFNSNEVKLVKNEAFLYLNQNGTVYFTANYIHQAEENSLTAFLAPSTLGAICNNTFNCNCGLDWIWQPSYAHIRETSYCILHGTVLSAKEVEPDYDDDGRCVELVVTDVSTIQSDMVYDMHTSSSYAVTQNVSARPIVEASVVFIILICYFTNSVIQK